MPAGTAPTPGQVVENVLLHEDGSPVATYVVGEWYHGAWHVHEFEDYRRACRAYVYYRELGRGVRMYKCGVLVEQQVQ